MKLQASKVCIALLVCTFCACPPRESFTIVITNEFVVPITSLTTGTPGPQGISTSFNLLSAPLAPGETETVTLNVSDAGIGTGLRVIYGQGATASFALGQPFEPGMTINVTVIVGNIIMGVSFPGFEFEVE